ncbi:MAG: hypothetical protein QN141_06465 [Armatimonadota bacterium]|nr:hypothetical protein [Armatimonadota bacterium]MDR7452355.1 hypothetical protein [Armatimonadota bacterium]MDR7466915.1 hypothetical protein [Armatimonadota bacterium]MDR7493543.1 hypothetical protein [Armatimonadota bacterium]MDR7498808.1 hypothetical protein [Armatimonadota bacterium]
MIEVVIVVCTVAAAVYLLRPLFAALIIATAVLASGAAAAPARDGPAIGLLLIAVDAGVDHLRISEAWRVGNPGPPREMVLRGVLPPGAQYLTFHRGVKTFVRTAEGFAAPVRLGSGLSEIAYSYLLPAGATAVVPRRFPLDVRRLEVVARGGRTRLRLDRGHPADPIRLDGQTLPRWEVRDLAADQTLTLLLDHLPASRPWLPGRAAAVLAVALGAGLTARIRRLPDRASMGTDRRTEETVPDSKNP